MLTITDATRQDLSTVETFLAANRLPEAGLQTHASDVLIARDGERVVGTAALEIYEQDALLRSVAVDAATRGTGLGQSITRAALDRAREKGVRRVFLLTETAPEFFRKFGFVDIDRNAVPPAIARTVEFASACPQSARVMTLTV